MSEEKINIYRKMQTARVKLQSLTLKKTGLNKFAGYSYFELGDILPAINNINSEAGLCTKISFGNEYASLDIINIDNPEEMIQFLSPMSKATLKGAHDIQNLGAVETYQRRYLYMSAYEIVEHDAVDSSKGKEPKKAMDAKSLELMIKTLESCDNVDSIKNLWNEAIENHLPSSAFQNACSKRKESLDDSSVSE